MGKTPLIGLIGACGIGILLTGCNCCNNKQNPQNAQTAQNTPNSKQQFAGGMTNTNLGVTGSLTKSPSNSPLISDTGTAGVNPSAVSSAAAAGDGLDSSSPGNGANAWGTGSSTAVNGGGMYPPSNSMASGINSGMPSGMNSGMPSGMNSGMPPGMNGGAASAVGGNGSLMISGSPSPISNNLSGSNYAGAGGIRRTSAVPDDLTGGTGVQNAGFDSIAAASVPSTGGAMVPPVPVASMTTLPPPPVSGSGTNPAPNAVPPSVSSLPASSGAGFATQQSTGAGSLTPKPPYLQ